MDTALKAAAIGAVTACAALLIKKYNPETAFLLSAAAVACICAAAVKIIGQAADAARQAEAFSGLSSGIYGPVFKCVGIGIISKISADLCRDASQSGTASAVEFAGTAAALIVMLPLFGTVLKMMGDML